MPGRRAEGPRPPDPAWPTPAPAGRPSGPLHPSQTRIWPGTGTTPATRPAKLCLLAYPSQRSTRTGPTGTTVTTSMDSDSFSDHGVKSRYKYRRKTRTRTGTARYPSAPYPTSRGPPGWPPQVLQHCRALRDPS